MNNEINILIENLSVIESYYKWVKLERKKRLHFENLLSDNYTGKLYYKYNYNYIKNIKAIGNEYKNKQNITLVNREYKFTFFDIILNEIARKNLDKDNYKIIGYTDDLLEKILDLLNKINNHKMLKKYPERIIIKFKKFKVLIELQISSKYNKHLFIIFMDHIFKDSEITQNEYRQLFHFLFNEIDIHDLENLLNYIEENDGTFLQLINNKSFGLKSNLNYRHFKQIISILTSKMSTLKTLDDMNHFNPTFSKIVKDNYNEHFENVLDDKIYGNVHNLIIKDILPNITNGNITIQDIFKFVKRVDDKAHLSKVQQCEKQENKKCKSEQYIFTDKAYLNTEQHCKKQAKKKCKPVHLKIAGDELVNILVIVLSNLKYSELLNLYLNILYIYESIDENNIDGLSGAGGYSLVTCNQVIEHLFYLVT